jgi:hypothetical protein
MNILSKSMLDNIKNIINDYCIHEFGHEADFSNLNSVGLAFTTLTDYEIPIQVCIDLENMKLKTWIGCEDESDEYLVECIDISYDEIKDNGFEFDSLIYGWDEYIEDNLDKYI